MSTKAQTSFRIQSWDEKPIQEFAGGGKIVSAHVTQQYEGDLAGNGVVEYLMYYVDDKNAIFTGYETIEGEFAGRAGAFVIRHDGSYAGNVANSQWSVVPGSATGELAGLAGVGSFSAGHGGQAEVTLNLTLEAD